MARGRDALAIKREERALELRLQGMRYIDIAADLGCSDDAAADAVRRALARSKDHAAGLADLVRELELERLAELDGTLWPRALMGDLRAVDRILNISIQRARLLGLYAPVKHEVTGKDGGPVEVDIAVAREELLGRLAGLHARSGENGGAKPPGSNGHRALPSAS